MTRKLIILLTISIILDFTIFNQIIGVACINCSTYQPHEPLHLDSLRGDFIHYSTKSDALQSKSDKDIAQEIADLVIKHFPDSREAEWMSEVEW